MRSIENGQDLFARNRDTHADTDAGTDGDASANGYCGTDTDPYTYAGTNGDAHADADGYSSAHRNTRAYSYAYANADSSTGCSLRQQMGHKWHRRRAVP